MLSTNIKQWLKSEKIKYGANTTFHSCMKPFRVSAHVYNADVPLCAGVRGSALCVSVCVNYPSLIKESGQGVAMETQLYTSCHSD